MHTLARISIGFILVLPLAVSADFELPPPPPVVTVTADDVSVTATQSIQTAVTFSATASDSGTLTYSIDASPSHGTLDTVSGNTVNYTSEASFTGTDTFTYTATSDNDPGVSGTGTVTVTVPGATFVVRNGSTLVWSGTVPLNADGAATTNVSPTAGGDSHAISANSVLAQLVTADTAQAEFAITDLQYNSSFSAFYLNCITIPTSLCGNWQYAITPSGGSLTYPAVGMDTTTLSNGDAAYIYYGSSRRISASATSVATGDSVTVTAENYNPSTDAYTPATGVTIGLIQGDPFGTYTTVSSTAADSSGQASFPISSAGTYYVGVAEDYYYPNEIIIASAPPAAPPASPSSGGGGGITVHPPFDVPMALAFIAGMQRADGSFDTPLLSDWVALAVAVGGAGDTQNKLKQYFIANPPSLQSITDYERHAMALEALGINPYSGSGVDYITPIVTAFDGTQFGDASLVNDDIFAIFPLLHAGYATSDDMIRKAIAFIVSKQRSDGSWEGSVDLTAAAIQALSLERSLPGASSGITSGINYIRAQQKPDGGFSNTSATGWALQAIAVTSDSGINWTIGINTPQYYLATLQQNDGGVEVTTTDAQTRLWATAYAIPGITGKTWDSLLTSFPKPAPVVPEPVIATSTPESATSTVVALSAPEPDPAPPTEDIVSEVAAEPEEVTPTIALSTPTAPATSSQVAAAATTSTNRLGWILAAVLLLLIAIAITLGLKRRPESSDA